MPVFVFDFAHENVWLLDRQMQVSVCSVLYTLTRTYQTCTQAVAYDDMVIAVQAKTPYLQVRMFQFRACSKCETCSKNWNADVSVVHARIATRHARTHTAAR
jgi:hypothetical protein